MTKRLNQRITRIGHLFRTTGAGGQHQRRRTGNQQHGDRRDDPARHIAFRVGRLLGCQRHALHGEEEPNGKRDGGPDAQVTVRQDARRSGRAFVRRDVGQIVEIEMTGRGDREDQ
ncbi:Mg2 transport transmembrane protein MgtE [Mycobacteroides abscessus subsp. massiliense]|nr:Mg2 transport transmembrane protein MgtE [Mycobacteroides abscessus subsp. massiliense]